MSGPLFSERLTDACVPFRVRGGDLAAVEFDMAPGDRVFAQPGTVICCSGDIAIDVDWGKNLLDPIKRHWAGEKATLTELIAEDRGGRAVIGASLPGRIVHLHLDGTKAIFCDKGAYLAHTGDIDIGVGLVRRLRAGLFGGQGFVMQRLTGYGDVFLHALGSVIDWSLEPGYIVKANTRNLLAFDDGVGFDIEPVGGFWATLFAGQGLVMARLQGPGRVICHSIDHLALANSVRLGSAREMKKMKGVSHAQNQGEKK